MLKASDPLLRKEVRGLYPQHVQNSVKSVAVNKSHKLVVLTIDLKEPSRGLLNVVTHSIKEQHLGRITCVKHNGRQVYVTTKLRSKTAKHILDGKISRLKSDLASVINLAAQDYRTPNEATHIRTASRRRSNVTRRRHFAPAEVTRQLAAT